MSYRKRYRMEDREMYGITENVEDMFDGDRNIKIEDVRKLRFELGGSPLSYVSTTINGKMFIDEKDVIYEHHDNMTDEEVEKVKDGYCIEYLIKIGNNISGNDLINRWNESKKWGKCKDDEWMTEEFLTNLCSTFYGDIPYHVWVDGEVN